MPDDTEAQDLMGDTVLIAFEAFGRLRDHSKFKYFLFGIAARQLKKRLRDKKHHAALSEAETLPHKDTYAGSGADVKQLYAAIDSLPMHEKEIVAMFELSGLSLKDIAQIKQMNLNTVKTHLSRGRENLIARLNPKRETIH